MAITVEQAMKIEGLNECHIRAGYKGISKLVKHVTIMEVPDIVQWLKGEELMLTSLYSIYDDEKAQGELIKQLHEKGTSALAIKPHRFIADIPEIILKEANKYDFPIIEIPKEIPYIDILSPVMKRIYSNRDVLYEDLQGAYQLMNETSLNRGGIQRLQQILSDFIKHDVFIESFVPYVGISEGQESLAPLETWKKDELEHMQRPTSVERVDRTTGEAVSCIVAPIVIDNVLYGTITSVDSDELQIDVALAILERASTLLALEFMRKKVTHELEQQYKSDFFYDLFFSQIQSESLMVEKGQLYGFDLNKKYLCMAIQFRFDKQGGLKPIAHTVDQLELICSQREKDAIIGSFKNGVYVLYPTAGKKVDRIHQEITLLYRELDRIVQATFYMGIGRPYFEIGNLRESLDQAERSVVLGRTFFEEKRLVFYEDLGVYRLFAEIKNTEEMHQFFGETVNALVEYDRDHDLELMETLRVYFTHNESLNQTSKALFIHVNTLKYRLQRIKLLTGLSVQSSEDKLMLHLGLKVFDFIKNDYRYQ
ncbi:PucR family transcriptional regulator ligand-binding domain-containing protein [Paenalkalicoccus suaedae]|uniref:PucR family transcriptional regulator ligand-binding domain-containing protein n=1 Tax=Paenalkalicoccus suaedae TaxID=2592382 RepID=A0A859FI38_9BACI|nr:PucR family transcriptional regulator [Paenalkalicoccus suaedae]QKS72344.1 PucR family transcriptional regulator ligand-binding domain-containing protein [Paenalkalicoccus suaedae]